MKYAPMMSQRVQLATPDPRTIPVEPRVLGTPPHASTGFSSRRTSQNEITDRTIMNIHAPAVP